VTPASAQAAAKVKGRTLGNRPATPRIVGFPC
jgi:hypothetical protein